MNFFLKNSRFHHHWNKVSRGERFEKQDALELYASNEVNELGRLADYVRQQKHGNRSSFIVNRYINYSNYCILSCQFCSFARKKRDADGFQYSVEEIVEKARSVLPMGVTELHIVGGLHPNLPFQYYLDMLAALKALDGRLQLKCFTAIEILHLAWLARKPLEDVLRTLKEAGLDSLTGGGAEIFDAKVRNEIARGKESADEYLDVHRKWHQLGGRSTCTMLYGHVENIEQRIDHLLRLRGLADETGGFTGFIPLAYQPDNNRLPVEHAPSGVESLKTIAISRLLLDSIPNITAYWIGLGTKLAQVALNYGANDLHGTIIEEKIFHMAGANSPENQTQHDLIKAIREVGHVPVQRDTFYQPIREFELTAAAA